MALKWKPVYYGYLWNKLITKKCSQMFSILVYQYGSFFARFDSFFLIKIILNFPEISGQI